MDLSTVPRRIHGLHDRPRAANLKDVVHTTAASEPEHLLVPVRSLLVIDDVRRSELLRNFDFFVRRRRRDDSGPRRDSKLEAKDRDTTRTLHENNVTALERDGA